MSLPVETREAVREAYNHCCGYCGVSEVQIGGTLEIDHFHPLAYGGSDVLDNLVYACTTCNRFKTNYWPSADAPAGFYLLHPGKDNLGEHIALSVNGYLQGLTQRGWFHIRWLHLNRPQLIAQRLLIQEEVALREAYEQAEQARILLQQRIYLLEGELVQLQELIRKLTLG
jgi:hypothetical protein